MADRPYNPNRNRNRRTNDVATEVVVIEGIFRGIGQIIMAIFRLFGGGKGGQNKASNTAQLQALQEPWEQVELHVLQEVTQAHAISEADKILDNALIILGYPGETMADRLRASEARFGSELYQQIWQAHKLRNTLAHEVGAQVGAAEARAAITTFRQALYKLGVLS